jgi:hypothetical protein
MRVHSSRRLVHAALAFYGVGVLAWVTGHLLVAGALYGIGIASAAVAAWRSRGYDAAVAAADGHRAEEPWSGPESVPHFDWASFERDFRSYAARERESAELDLDGWSPP